MLNSKLTWYCQVQNLQSVLFQLNCKNFYKQKSSLARRRKIESQHGKKSKFSKIKAALHAPWNGRFTSCSIWVKFSSSTLAFNHFQFINRKTTGNNCQQYGNSLLCSSHCWNYHQTIPWRSCRQVRYIQVVHQFIIFANLDTISRNMFWWVWFFQQYYISTLYNTFLPCP